MIFLAGLSFQRSFTPYPCAGQPGKISSIFLSSKWNRQEDYRQEDERRGDGSTWHLPETPRTMKHITLSRAHLIYASQFSPKSKATSRQYSPPELFAFAAHRLRPATRNTGSGESPGLRRPIRAGSAARWRRPPRGNSSAPDLLRLPLQVYEIWSTSPTAWPCNLIAGVRQKELKPQTADVVIGKQSFRGGSAQTRLGPRDQRRQGKTLPHRPRHGRQERLLFSHLAAQGRLQVLPVAYDVHSRPGTTRQPAACGTFPIATTRPCTGPTGCSPSTPPASIAT